MNSKHRQLQSEQENLIHNIEPSRSTSNLSFKTQSTVNTENVTIKFTDKNKESLGNEKVKPLRSSYKSVNYNSQSDFINGFRVI